jgi:hypothetical protein
MTRRRNPSFAPHQAYHSSERFHLSIFDVRIPGAAERLHRERARWQERSDIEALDEAHFVLVVRYEEKRGTGR